MASAGFIMKLLGTPKKAGDEDAQGGEVEDKEGIVDKSVPAQTKRPANRFVVKEFNYDIDKRPPK